MSAAFQKTPRYHVYGLGNALLDLDFQVSMEQLEKLNVNKGVMTLIDEVRHHELLEQLKAIRPLRTCGGSAANTMVALAQLGGRGFYSCKVANDKTGAFYLEDLQQQGVATNLRIEDCQSGITGKCIAMITPDADRTMNTFLGITKLLSQHEINALAITQAQYLYIEGYLVSHTVSRKTAIEARHIAEQAGIKTSLTLSDPNMAHHFADGLRDMLGNGVDLLFCNEQEALIFTQSQTLRGACATLKKYAKTFVVTRGAEGSLVFDGKRFIEITALDTHAIDTLGAGDMYAGAFLYAITQGHNYAMAGEIANLAAGHIVSKLGVRLNSEEAHRLLGEISRQFLQKVY